jgi:hypothetical protein
MPGTGSFCNLSVSLMILLGSGADMFALALLSQALKVDSWLAYRSVGAVGCCSLSLRALATVLQCLYGSCRAWMKSCGLVEVVCLVKRPKKFAITCVAAQHTPPHGVVRHCLRDFWGKGPAIDWIIYIVYLTSDIHSFSMDRGVITRLNNF